jgi:hypothetical protein
MVLHPIKKPILRRMRSLVKREEDLARVKGRESRVMKVFGRLKNIDSRKYAEWGHLPNAKQFIDEVGKEAKGPGYAVRVMKVKGTKGVVIKYPTLAEKTFAVTPLEEIKFVRKLTEKMNAEFSGQGVVLKKPFGHAVGNFIVMEKTNLVNIGEILFMSNRSARARAALKTLSKAWGLNEADAKKKLSDLYIALSLKSTELIRSEKVRLSKKYPSREWVTNAEGVSFRLHPFDAHHLQIIGVKKGVLQLVPIIDAI